MFTYLYYTFLEPPVPNIKTVTINAKGFYNQEFEPQKQDHPKKMPLPSSMDSPSPDLFYSSSPEPEDFFSTGSKLTGSSNQDYYHNRRKWHDLDPDSEDEEGGNNPMTNGNNADHPGIKVEVKEEKGPPKISERPKSPVADLVVPIPIKPKPSQIITMNSVKEMDKENKMEEEEDPVAMARSKSALPVKSTNR